jgi:hypothetical protein
MPTRERRGRTRHALLATALVHAGDQQLGPYVVHDLSATGARLSGAALYPVGASLTLTLDLGERRRVSLVAHVVRHARDDAQSFAVEFVPTADAVADQIERFARELALYHRSYAALRVLVVERDDAARAALAREIGLLGRAAVTFASSATAQQWTRAPEHPYDTALVALVRPDPAGTAFLGHLARSHPTVRRVAICHAHHAAPVGCDEILHTPWRRVDLARAVA